MPFDLSFSIPATLSMGVARPEPLLPDCALTCMTRAAVASSESAIVAPSWTALPGAAFPASGTGAAVVPISAGGAFAVVNHVVADITLWCGASASH